jgi:glucosamine--fructose-6-phosphate aminotransferase (isomerizing)
MCGIVGVIGQAPAAPLILEALRRLEYRGYDSAGIATLVGRAIERRRAEGKLGNLGRCARRSAAAGHDRHRPHPLGDAWRARPSQRASARHRRASPWCTTASSRTTPSCATSWRPRGQRFETETDTETVAQLLDRSAARTGLAAGSRPSPRHAAAARRLRAGRRVRRPRRT